MPKIETENGAIHYQQSGTGPEVVLLHGLAGNFAFWYPEVISRLEMDYRVTAFDLRGHGYSDTTYSGYTTEHMTKDLLSLCDALSIRRPHLVGHSFGGAVALHFATLYPSRTRSVILADVRIRSLQPKQNLRNSPLWEKIQIALRDYGIEVPIDDEEEWQLLEVLARHRLAGAFKGVQSPGFFVPFLSGSIKPAEKWLQLVDHTVAIEEFKDMKSLTKEAIASISIPVQTIYGELSHCKQTQRVLDEILPHCSQHRVKDVGHFHPFVKPEAFVETVKTFLSQISDPTCVDVKEVCQR